MLILRFCLVGWRALILGSDFSEYWMLKIPTTRVQIFTKCHYISFISLKIYEKDYIIYTLNESGRIY